MFLNVFIISIVLWFFFEIVAVTGFLRFIHDSFVSKRRLSLAQLIYKQIKNSMLHMAILEIIWTLLPVLALITIALPSLAMLYYFALSFSPELVVHVIGHQWYWSYEFFSAFTTPPSNLDFLYTNSTNYLFNINEIDVLKSSQDRIYTFGYESIMISPEDLKAGSFRLLEVDKPLYLPVNVKIRVIVSSDDVLHSWAVPSLGIKIDCVPGRLNVVEFKIARSGVFYGQCSEICGTQHGFMPICVIALPSTTFYQYI
jgi:heme/copper-type cytochrome/quinol oxidase subunit 2